MTFKEYKEEIKSDIRNYLTENNLWDKDYDILYDYLWIEDSVTGNGSGSYTFSRYQAEENVKDVIFDKELLDLFKEFGDDRVPLEKGAEFIDVSIRCFLLGECLDAVLEEHEEE